MTAAAWPNMKRGNPYRHTWTFSFTEGTIVGVRAYLKIKTRESDADSAALLSADTEGGSGGDGGITLSAGVQPLTAVATFDLPAADTAAIAETGWKQIGLQLFLQNDEPFEMEDSVLEKRIFVHGDVVRSVVEPVP